MSQEEQTDTRTTPPLQQVAWHRSACVSLVTRLKPGDDLKIVLQEAAAKGGFQAAAISTCVGSLSVAHLRLASAKQSKSFDGPFEIVSLVGTLSPEGVHLHLCIADDEGQVFGGHLLAGSIVHTTAEITLTVFEDLAFSRPEDTSTGYGELSIRKI